MANENKIERQDRDRKVLDGITKHFPSGKTLKIAGEDVKPGDIVAKLEENILAANATDQAKKSYREALDKEQKTELVAKSTRRDVKNFVIGTFGETSPVLADFGFRPKKARKVPIKVQAAAIEKRAATRARKTGNGGPEVAAR